MTESKSASFIDVIIRSRTIPALFTSTSRRPNASTACSTMAAQSSQLVTDAKFATARPPSASISVTTPSAGRSSLASP